MASEFTIIPIVAFAASLLTFFSGFGLGTILTPVFAVWFPIELAVTLTAIVHFLNNAFKFVLVGKFTNKSVLLKFGLPAIAFAFLGALVLGTISDLPSIASYELAGKLYYVSPVKLTIAGLMIFFTLFEIVPYLRDLQIDAKFLPVGGVLSGFFGGISGHQGALRSAFLVRAGLTKESFIATGVAIACLIDMARLSVYSKHLSQTGVIDNIQVVAIATLAAFAGAFLGNRLLKKLTLEGVQKLVSFGLLLLAIALGSGII